MSDVQDRAGWWLASDGRWYPPEQRPGPVQPPPSGGPPGRRNVPVVALTIAVGVMVVIAAAFVLTRDDSTDRADQGSAAVTSAPVVMPSAPEASRDTTAYNAMLALGIVDTFTSSATVGGQDLDVVIDLTEIYQPGQSFGVNVHDSLEGNVLFYVPTNTTGQVQATFTLLDPDTSSPAEQLTVFFTAEGIDRVFLTGSGAPVELERA